MYSCLCSYRHICCQLAEGLPTFCATLRRQVRFVFVRLLVDKSEIPPGQRTNLRDNGPAAPSLIRHCFFCATKPRDNYKRETTI